MWPNTTNPAGTHATRRPRHSPAEPALGRCSAVQAARSNHRDRNGPRLASGSQQREGKSWPRSPTTASGSYGPTPGAAWRTPRASSRGWPPPAGRLTSISPSAPSCSTSWRRSSRTGPYPSGAQFARLNRMFAAGEFDKFAQAVVAINHALTFETYRSPEAEMPVLDEDDPSSDLHWSDVHPSGKREPLYFEVLLVETLTEAQERNLRKEAAPGAAPTTSSSTDRRGAQRGGGLDRGPAQRQSAGGGDRAAVRHADRPRSECPGRFRRHDDRRPAREDEPPDVRSAIPARRCARSAPGLDLYLMTEVDVENVAGRLGRDFRRVFHAREGLLELHPEPAERRCGALPYAVLQRAQGVQPAADGRVSRPAHLAGQVDREVALDQRHGGLLRPRHLHGGNLGDVRGLDSLLEPTGPLRKPSSWPHRRSGRGRPTSSPTAPRRPTRSSPSPWWHPATSCCWTATATSLTTTG